MPGPIHQDGINARSMACNEFTRHELVQRFVQRGGLNRVGQQAQGGESAAGVALRNQVDAREQRVEHLAAVALAIRERRFNAGLLRLGHPVRRRQYRGDRVSERRSRYLLIFRKLA